METINTVILQNGEVSSMNGDGSAENSMDEPPQKKINLDGNILSFY